MKVEIVLLSIAGLLTFVSAHPAGLDLGFLTLDNGNVGVNFGGYRAQAGLGGILSGDRTAGGLHASAGTPNGANARAGLAGVLSGQGHGGGHLYASSSLDGEGGEVYTPSRYHGGGQLHASAWPRKENSQASINFKSHQRVDSSEGVPIFSRVGHTGTRASAGLGGVVSGNGYAAGYLSADAQLADRDSHLVTNHGSVSSPGVHGTQIQDHKSVTIQQDDTHTHDTNHHQIHESTWQPNQVHVEHIEKVGPRISSKIDKTRITTITKTKWNPSVDSGVFVEKEIEPATANFNVNKYVEKQISPVNTQQFQYQNSAASSAAGSASASASLGGNGGYNAGGFGGGYQTNFYTKHQPSPQLFDDIFNIPISTLTAVNQLLRNKGK